MDGYMHRVCYDKKSNVEVKHLFLFLLSLIFSSFAVLVPEPINPQFIKAKKSFVAAKAATYIVDAQ
jgi:hypothetical protein